MGTAETAMHDMIRETVRDVASEFATEAAARAVQTHGGNGFTREYEVYDIWQNARVTRTVPVANEVARNFIAEHHLGLPRSY